MKIRSQSQSTAFTLVELLVVMGIIVLMATLVVPAVSGSLKGTAMNQAAQTILSQFNNAQQTALARGQLIELRFIVCGDPDSPVADSEPQASWKVRGMQIYNVQPNMNADTLAAAPLNFVPLSKADFFPNSVIIDNKEKLSSLCDTSSNNTSHYQAPSTRSEDAYLLPKLPRIGNNYAYYKFRYRADGTTDLDPNKPWFVTLHDINKGDKLDYPPPNYFTVSIDPVQGATRVFRPQ